MLYDFIIIGGGPAGVTAGIYASRKKLNVLLIAKDFFGQIAKTGQVDNWPGEMAISGMALAGKLEKHLRQFPIEIKTGQKVVAVQTQGIQGTEFLESSNSRNSVPLAHHFIVQVESGEVFEAKALIIATGRNAKTLGIEGEQNFIGKGLSYCAICDAPFFKDKQVAIIGGGNGGFATALDLAKYAKKVFVFDKADKVSASEILQDQVSATGKAEILIKTEIFKIQGDKKIQSITFKNLETGKTFQQPMDGVFVQIGSVPATGFLNGLVDFNEKNEIKVDDTTLQTSADGIFAAGDCNDAKYKQLIIAAGQGAVAALSAYEYLQSC